eukprot:5178199-Prymnesium_polylepis.1
MAGTTLRMVADLGGLVMLFIVAWGTVLSLSTVGRFSYLAGFEDGQERCELTQMALALSTVVLVWGACLAFVVLNIYHAKAAKTDAGVGAPKAPIVGPDQESVFDRTSSGISQFYERSTPARKAAPMVKVTRKRSMSLPAKLVAKKQSDHLPDSLRFANGSVAAATRALTGISSKVFLAPDEEDEPETPAVQRRRRFSTGSAPPAYESATRKVAAMEVEEDINEVPILLSSWYPTIGLVALCCFLLQYVNPEWAHPTPPPEDRTKGPYTFCSDHSDCFHLTGCPGEGLRG